ncbi:MAG: Pilin/Flagellin, PilA family [Candidatus Methanohalarchaeum thermophilum]|uniref:Pilin/Flagellin, PilA family n=1 Tax=Methanohalarchaeum thermophilum TaxID=1903181 RepID=A0A1Q6DWG0_METT1|nr:MAG: Pilin/Flagellin, PilA family [Candidatus Methanohalarchaeum thermophilum]
MKEKLKILKEKEGVSPVIGVILMVAITVIMAAIVAGFVFGVIQTPQATPVASMTIDDISNSSSNVSVTVLHQSGDSLNVSDIKVVITEKGNTTNTATNTSIQTTGSDTGTWSTGERITFYCNNDNNVDYIKGSDYEVRIVHTPSGGTISAPTATAD